MITRMCCLWVQGVAGHVDALLDDFPALGSVAEERLPAKPSVPRTSSCKVGILNGALLLPNGSDLPLLHLPWLVCRRQRPQ